MLRQRLSERFGDGAYHSTPRSTQNKLKPEQPAVSEWKLAAFGLIVSLVVIAAKLCLANYDVIKAAVIDRQLFSFEVTSEDGRIMYQYAWRNVMVYSSVWLPIVCGALATYFTWIMVYLDSYIPGELPPSPLSPSKFKTRSGHVFHLNYVFAVVIGILVATYMFWRNISIQF